MSYPDNNGRPIKRDVMKKAEEAVRAFKMSNAPDEHGGDKILSDVLGSYTGTPYDGREPDQDADDL